MNTTSRTTDNRKRLFSNFAALGIIQGTNFLLPILVMPYVIKRVGADGFGVIAIAQVVMMFFATVADYGFNLTATRDVSLRKDNRNAVSKIFFSVLITRLLICLALFLLLVLSVILVPFFHQYAVLYLLAFCTVIGQSIQMNWLFQAIERMKYVTYISLFARLVFVLLVVLFIKTKSDIIYFIFFAGIGNILAGLMSIAVAIKVLKLKIKIPSGHDVLNELENGWHITVSNLSVSTYMYINVIVLRLFTNDATVGYYSVAEKVIQAARQILSVYFQGIYPQVCQLAISGKEQLLIFFKKYYLSFLLVVLLGCCICFLFSFRVVSFFLDNHRELSAQCLRILSFVPFIICLNIPAYQVLLANHEKKSLLRIFIFGTLINLTLNLLMVKNGGPIATCYVVLVTELLITAGLIYEMVKNPKTMFLNIIV